MAALAAGNAADAASTLGQAENNPMLGSRFGARAWAIKSGAVAGTVAIQWWLVRKHGAISKPLAIGNFVTAAALGGLAARNVRVARGAARAP